MNAKQTSIRAAGSWDNRVFRPCSIGEIIAEPLPPYQIKGILARGGVNVIFGDSQSGKTFLMLDMAASVATGSPFAGKKTKKGSVLYVSAEGNGGLGKRLRALAQKYPGLPEAPLRIIRQPVDLIDMLNDLESRVYDLQDDQGDLGLIVLDTLSQTLGGRDENGPDMATYIKAATRLAAVFSVPVVIIHHIGKDATRGARGNSSLRCNVDGMFRITNSDGQRGMAGEKMRDGDLESMGFTLRIVPVGHDEDGEEQTSCVVEWGGAAPQLTNKPVTGAAQKLVFQLANGLAKSAGEAGKLTEGRAVFLKSDLLACWAATKKSSGEAKQAAPSYCNRAIDRLTSSGHLQSEGEALWLS